MSNKKRIKKRLSDLKKTKKSFGVLILGNGSVIHMQNISVAPSKIPKVKSYSYKQQVSFWYPYEEKKKEA